MASKPSLSPTKDQDVPLSSLRPPKLVAVRSRQPIRPVPDKKFALLLFPIAIFSACIALFVLSVTAITECRPYRDEEEESMIVIRSYPTKANYSMIAMSIFGFFIPVYQYLTNPYSRRLGRFYNYGFIAGCYYVLFIWAVAEITAYATFAVRIMEHFDGIALLYISIGLLGFISIMILGYMFVPGNPLTRQRKRSAPQYDPDDEEDEEDFRGRELVTTAERVSRSNQTSESRASNQKDQYYLENLPPVEAHSIVNNDSLTNRVPIAAQNTNKADLPSTMTRNSLVSELDVTEKVRSYAPSETDRNSLASLSIYTGPVITVDGITSAENAHNKRFSLTSSSFRSMTPSVAENELIDNPAHTKPYSRFPSSQATTLSARNSQLSSSYDDSDATTNVEKRGSIGKLSSSDVGSRASTDYKARRSSQQAHELMAPTH